MATPAAAGSALLVRDYFSNSNTSFWVGMCNHSYVFCNAFTPSGVLVKTVLQHSGSPMTLYNGGGTADIPLGSPPDFMQGYGRVTLSNVLPLKGVYTSHDLYVDDLHSISQGATVTYTVNVLSSAFPLK